MSQTLLMTPLLMCTAAAAFTSRPRRSARNSTTGSCCPSPSQAPALLRCPQLTAACSYGTTAHVTRDYRRTWTPTLCVGVAAACLKTLLFTPCNTLCTAAAPCAQAQTFCPQFHHKQLLPLTLTGPSLAALASAECSVQLWHHCPRSQAVAAALSRGHSSSYVMAGQHQVLLGSGSCPLQALLTRPQVREWHDSVRMFVCG